MSRIVPPVVHVHAFTAMAALVGHLPRTDYRDC
jgi:hypothetical protein